MFERFSRGARAAVVAAQGEARALGHERIGPEDLLLGVAVTPGRAADVLASHGFGADALRAATRPPIDPDALASIGIDLEEIRRRAEASFGPGALERGRGGRRGHVPFTPEAKKALELALREALHLGDREIGAEHVLLGLLREGSVVASLVVPAAELRAALTPAGSRRGRGG